MCKCKLCLPAMIGCFGWIPSHFQLVYRICLWNIAPYIWEIFKGSSIFSSARWKCDCLEEQWFPNLILEPPQQCSLHIISTIQTPDSDHQQNVSNKADIKIVHSAWNRFGNRWLSIVTAVSLTGVIIWGIIQVLDNLNAENLVTCFF